MPNHKPIRNLNITTVQQQSKNRIVITDQSALTLEHDLVGRSSEVISIRAHKSTKHLILDFYWLTLINSIWWLTIQNNSKVEQWGLFLWGLNDITSGLLSGKQQHLGLTVQSLNGSTASLMMLQIFLFRLVPLAKISTSS